MIHIRGVATCTQIRTCVQLDAESIESSVTAKSILSGHSNIDKKNPDLNNKSRSLMKVKSIAECSPWKILQYAPVGAFCNTFDLHKAMIGLKTNFGLHFEWPLKTGLQYFIFFWKEICNL